MKRALVLIGWLAAAVAGAQGLELDLSEPSTPKEFRPGLVLLGVRANDDASQARSGLLEAELVRMLPAGDQFDPLVLPAQAKEKLGDEVSAATACSASDCFSRYAAQIGAERALTVWVSKAPGGSTVEVRAWDPALPQPLVENHEVIDKNEAARFAGMVGKNQAQKDREFAKRAAVLVMGMVAKLTTPNGKLVVDNVDASAKVEFDGFTLGAGSIERVVSRGTHTVRVSSADYQPFEQQVTIEPLKSATVKVTLVAKPIDRPVVIQQKKVMKYPPLYTRPGLYVAAVGAIVTIIGFVVGAGALAVQSRAKDLDGDGVVEVTRLDAKRAQGSAVLANVLVGLGVAAIAGGSIWIAVTPPSPHRVDEPGESGLGAMGITLGGRW